MTQKLYLHLQISNRLKYTKKTVMQSAEGAWRGLNSSFVLEFCSCLFFFVPASPNLNLWSQSSESPGWAGAVQSAGVSARVASS